MKHIQQRNYLFIALLISLLPLPTRGDRAWAQEQSMPEGESVTLTLQEAILQASEKSVDAAIALNRLRTAYWEYRTYKADLLPEINLQGNIPNYRRGFNLYQTEDGSYKFVRNNYLQMDAKLSIDQNIPWTGGRVSIESVLEYVSPYGSLDHFRSVPISIRLNQPLFAYNHLKWQKKIQPVRYMEAKAEYIERTEQTTIKTISHYFELLLADENVNIAEQNRANADRLFEVAKAKRKMGQISENELLQLELNVLRAQARLTEAESDRNSKLFQLQSFLGLEGNQNIQPVMPEEIASFELSYADVLAKAKQNNAFAQRIHRIQLEADANVAYAKGQRNKIDLFASIGYTGQNHVFEESYRNLADDQIVQVGVRIPLVDWGKRKGKVKVAESNREVVRTQLKEQTMKFDQDIFLLVEHFNNQARQLDIAQKADEIAQKRYQTSIETFMIGKISTLELNDAQTAKDEARQKHIQELYLFWNYLYRIRSITLYDFTTEKTLEADFQKLLER